MIGAVIRGEGPNLVVNGNALYAFVVIWGVFCAWIGKTLS